MSGVRLAVAFLESRTGRYLGVTRKDNSNDWGLPGGKVDGYESTEAAIIREVKEETGLDVVPESLEILFADYDTPESDFYVVTYGGRTTGEVATSETGKVGWVFAEQLTSGSFSVYNQRLFDKLFRSGRAKYID